MYDRSFTGAVWPKCTVLFVLGSLVFAGGYVTALWVSPHMLGFVGLARAAAQPQDHPHEAHEGDLAPFMIRNAYHFATLYHAARAGRWELAHYQADELDENMQDAAQAATIHASFLHDYRKDFMQPLRQAIAARSVEQFHNAFRTAVEGCNNCHQATKHAFITIPEVPPSLSIFVLPPSGG